MLKPFIFANKLLWREWRAGEWFIVFFALIAAITATTSLHFYVDRLNRGFHQQTAALLGGDLVISSATPFPHAWLQKAKNLHLQTAEVWSYSSVVSSKQKLQLVNIQAVSSLYPLIGNAVRRPDAHTVWVEERLLPLLAINKGDPLTIGVKHFKVENTLALDKDILYTGWIMAPRLLMRLEDVAATRTVIPGSRVDYRLLLTGKENDLQQFRHWVSQKLNAQQQLQDVNHQQFALRDILQRTQSYLQLILLICLIMSGVAIALSMQQFLQRHFAHVALYRALGATRRQIILIFFWQLLFIGMLAGIIGVTIGYCTHEVYASLFKNFLQFSLPAASITPVLLGLITALLLLFLFAFPVISSLPQTSPLSIWRNDPVKQPVTSIFYFIFSFLLITAFVYSISHFSLLTFLLLVALLMSIAGLYFISFFILKLIRIFMQRADGAMRRGLHHLIQYKKNWCLQFIGFNLIFISLIVLALVRNNVIDSWRLDVSKGTPNYFAINIAPTDVPALKNYLQQHNIATEGIYPMVRGRLIGLNQKPILAVIPKKAIDNPALHRELNLTWMWGLPSDNKVVSGTLFTRKHGDDKARVSVLYKFAKDLHLHLGDELTFLINGEHINAKIVNFRTLHWTSFHPNFYMIFAPGLIDRFPTTYITSFYLSPNQTTLMNQLVQKFPNITIIDVATLLLQMQELIGKITLAMQYLFILALGSGVLIFIAGLKATIDERKQTYYLLNVLGASKKFIRNSIIMEFVFSALIIASTSILFALLITFFIT